jgi:hypothetical protein
MISKEQAKIMIDHKSCQGVACENCPVQLKKSQNKYFRCGKNGGDGLRYTFNGLRNRAINILKEFTGERFVVPKDSGHFTVTMIGSGGDHGPNGAWGGSGTAGIGAGGSSGISPIKTTIFAYVIYQSSSKEFHSAYFDRDKAIKKLRSLGPMFAIKAISIQ